jgi:hypothetical protein
MRNIIIRISFRKNDKKSNSTQVIEECFKIREGFEFASSVKFVCMALEERGRQGGSAILL